MRIVSSILAGGLVLAAITTGGCSAAKHDATAESPSSTTTSRADALPGSGKPPVTIGDKNFTEEFVLGELYAQALTAQGYSVQLNRNIGPTEVTMQALYSGRLDVYPEYLSTWNDEVAGYRRSFRTQTGAYRAARRYARMHGLRLLDPTPFSDTNAIAVTRRYGSVHRLRTIADLRKVAPMLSLGAPPEVQPGAGGVETVEQAYGFVPATLTPLEVGAQYQALDQGSVQAAEVNTTDGQLVGGNYTLLRDPRKVFGWGQAVPVVPRRVLAAEGPAFAATIDRVSSLLSTAVMRRLNAAVDVQQRDPALVAKQFLQARGILPVASP